MIPELVLLAIFAGVIYIVIKLAAFPQKVQWAIWLIFLLVLLLWAMGWTGWPYSFHGGDHFRFNWSR